MGQIISWTPSDVAKGTEGEFIVFLLSRTARWLRNGKVSSFMTKEKNKTKEEDGLSYATLLSS